MLRTDARLSRLSRTTAQLVGEVARSGYVALRGLPPETLAKATTGVIKVPGDTLTLRPQVAWPHEAPYAIDETSCGAKGWLGPRTQTLQVGLRMQDSEGEPVGGPFSSPRFAICSDGTASCDSHFLFTQPSMRIPGRRTAPFNPHSYYQSADQLCNDYVAARSGALVAAYVVAGSLSAAFGIEIGAAANIPGELNTWQAQAQPDGDAAATVMHDPLVQFLPPECRRP